MKRDARFTLFNFVINIAGTLNSAVCTVICFAVAVAS